MSSIFDQEPIFWTTTLPGYNSPDREKWTFKDGKKVRIRHPQVGHQGDYDDKKRAKGVRFVYMVRHDGHVAPIVLTNAAAHLDAHTEYGKMVLAKARMHGWFMPGACPCALVRLGELRPDRICDESILTDEPCLDGTYNADKPCKHSISETKARRAAHEAEEREREASYRGEAEKLLAETKETNAALRELAASMATQPSKVKGPKGTSE